MANEAEGVGSGNGVVDDGSTMKGVSSCAFLYEFIYETCNIFQKVVWERTLARLLEDADGQDDTEIFVEENPEIRKKN